MSLVIISSRISSWTDNQKMKLNEKKCKVMIFNETIKYQFTTRLQLNNSLLDIIDSTKLLGVIISDDTKLLVRRAYQRTIILTKIFEFDVPQADLINIYILFI